MSATSTSIKREAVRLAVAGVLYAEDFDDDTPSIDKLAEPALEPEFIEPTFTTEELDQARVEARATGRAEAERGLIASRLQILSTIATEMTEARASALAHAEDMTDAMVRSILSALVACLPEMCARHGAAELRALSKVILPLLTDEPHITIRAHPQMIPVIEDEVNALDFEIAQHIKLVSIEAMIPGDMRVNWADGAAIRDTARVRAAIQDVLAQLGLLEQDQLQPEMINA